MTFRYRASFLLSVLLTGLAGLQVKAAERIYARYSLFERSISVQSLEIYAKEGRYTDDLATYGRFLKKDQLETVRAGLLTTVDLDPLTIAQFLYTPIGERLLKRVSAVVRPRSGIEGDRALRSALILAAAEPDGLTALNVLKKYPTQGLQVDLKVGLELFEEAQTLIQQTQEVVVAIEAAARNRTTPVEYGLVESRMAQAGPYQWQKTSFEFHDTSDKRLDYSGRSQPYPVDLYLPAGDIEEPLPIAVISHGLNSSRESFDYLAEHLASNGYAVVVPEHLGSSRDQLNALLSGQANDVISRTEFLDRPLDISHALNELEKQTLNSVELTNKLDFQRVGVIGQSFGGYTSLALGGAKLDFEKLKADCDVNLDNTYNLSLLLQCLALRLEVRDYDLSDPRVKGVIALNPVGSSLFGPKGMSQIKIPTLIAGGTSDTVSPLVPEQVLPYRWLKTPNRYFAMVNGGTHFSFIRSEPTETDIPQLKDLLGQRPDIAQGYLKTLSLAFLDRHIRGQAEPTNLLTSSHGALLSRQPLKLSILSDLPPIQTESFSSQSVQP